jgi:hypothetical protein
MYKKIDMIPFLIWVYIIMALPFFSLLYLLKSPLPESDFYLDSISGIPDLPTIIASCIALLFLGSLISVFRGTIKALYFWKLDRKEKKHIATIAILLAIVLWNFFSVLNNFSYLGLGLLFIFFLLYLPTVNSYLNSMNFNRFREYLFSDTKQTVHGVIQNVLFSLVILLAIHSVALIADSQIRAYNRHQLLLSRYPHIDTVSPTIVYFGNKVVLTGRNFGWSGSKSRIRSSAGKVDGGTLTNEKAIITVPLDWKEGHITLWVEKPVEWESKTTVVKSNEVKLHLISRDNGWDEEDDAYMEQLQYLDEEVLKLNGY